MEPSINRDFDKKFVSLSGPSFTKRIENAEKIQNKKHWILL